MNTRSLMRWAGVSAMVAGSMFVVVAMFDPLNTLASVTTAHWAIIYSLAIAMCFFGLLGVTGIYGRQAKEAGWLGLAGYLLLSLWLVLSTGVVFADAFILPLLASEAPTFVESFQGLSNGHPGAMNLGALATVYSLSGFMYVLGGLLFSIATLRAGILSRWPAGLLAVAATLTPAAALLPPALQGFAMVPTGLALAWLGYELWSERRAPAAEPVPGAVSPRLRHTRAE